MFPCLRGRGGKEASLEMVYTVQKIDGLTSTGEFSGCLQKNVDVSRARPYESDQKKYARGKEGRHRDPHLSHCRNAFPPPGQHKLTSAHGQHLRTMPLWHQVHRNPTPRSILMEIILPQSPLWIPMGH